MLTFTLAIDPSLIACGVILALIALAIATAVIPLLILQRRARKGGVQVTLRDLVFMRLRKIDPRLIVNASIAAREHGLDINLTELESHHLAGGDVAKTLEAAILARTNGLDIPWIGLVAINLTRRDPVEAVRSALTPRTLRIGRISVKPPDGRPTQIAGSVQVVTELNRLVGGAGEDDLLTRLAEAIRNAASISDSADAIEQNVRAVGCDRGTALRILSLEIELE